MLLLILGLILSIIVAGLLMAATYIWGTYNMFQTGVQDIKTQWSNIKTEYQRRADLFYNLAEAVRSYKVFEKETLVEVIQARSGNFGPNQAKEMAKMQKLDSKLSGVLSKLMLLVERYPKLEANQNYQKLMEEVRITEDRVNVSRTDYNEIVGDFNKQVNMFPSNIVANMFKFQAQEFFDNEPQTTVAPKMKL